MVMSPAMTKGPMLHRDARTRRPKYKTRQMHMVCTPDMTCSTLLLQHISAPRHNRCRHKTEHTATALDSRNTGRCSAADDTGQDTQHAPTRM